MQCKENPCDMQEKTMDSTLNVYNVLTATPKGHAKNITVRSREGSVSIRVHRFATVGKGDCIRFGAAGSSRVFVVSKDKGELDIPLTPLFSENDSISLGKEIFQIQIREIQSSADMQAFEFLEQFHYKTNSSLGEKIVELDGKAQSTSVGGRRAVLYASIKIGERWLPAGYVDLQMPLMMCKPRHVLFNHPYTHPKRAIAWQCWNQDAIKKYLNTVVRIGRIVVSPELRGLGITRRMIKAAKKFSAERWHIGGMRPIFMEISAEMLNHIDFVSSSGFKFAGWTEGNITRVVKDMEQMMSLQPAGEFGMMSLQRKYLRVLQNYCTEKGFEFKEGLDMLKHKIEQNQDSLTLQEWTTLRPLIRHPIQYYISPLDDYSGEYLQETLSVQSSISQPANPKKNFSANSTQISIEKMSIRASYTIPKTKAIKAIMNAFGLQGDTVYFDIVKNISVKASSGNVILVAGASGSGKSVFLNALDPSKTLNRNLVVERAGSTKIRSWMVASTA